jgi:hypothetical protein
VRLFNRDFDDAGRFRVASITKQLCCHSQSFRRGD